MKLLNLLVIMGLITAQGFADGVWTNYQKDAAHTGYIDAKSDSRKFRIRWIKDYKAHEDERTAKSTSQPVLTDDLLYFIMESTPNTFRTNGIYALNPQTGEEVWRTVLDDSRNISGPVYNDGSLYLTQFQGSIEEDNGFIQAYDAKTGALQYSEPLSLKWYDTFNQPVIFGDHIYVAKAGKQYSIDAKTGQVDWLEPLGDRNQLATVTEDYIIRLQDVGIDVVDRITGLEPVYIRGVPGEETSMTNRAPVWDEKNKTLYAVIRIEDPDDHVGWVPTQLTAFDLDNKSIKWSLQLPAIFQPVLAGDTLYFSSDNKVYEVDALTGNVNWMWQSPTTAEQILVTKNHVFVNSHNWHNKTYAISRTTHKKAWEINMHGYMSADENNLYIISAFLDVRITAVALH